MWTSGTILPETVTTLDSPMNLTGGMYVIIHTKGASCNLIDYRRCMELSEIVCNEKDELHIGFREKVRH